MGTTLDYLAESVVCQDHGLWEAKMSAHNPLISCQNLTEIAWIVFEIWPFKDGPLETVGGFLIPGQVLQPVRKLYKKWRQAYLAYLLLSLPVTTTGSLRSSPALGRVGVSRIPLGYLLVPGGWTCLLDKSPTRKKKIKKYSIFF